MLRSLREIAESHLGPIDDRRHSLGEPGPIEAVLGEAGFHDIRSKRFAQTLRFTDGSDFVRLNAMALVSMRAASGALDDEARQRVVATILHDSAEFVRLRTDEAGFAYEIGTSGDGRPPFTTIAGFIARSLDAIAELFTEVLLVCSLQGLIGQK